MNVLTVRTGVKSGALDYMCCQQWPHVGCQTADAKKRDRLAKKGYSCDTIDAHQAYIDSQ